MIGKFWEEGLSATDASCLQPLNSGMLVLRTMMASKLDRRGNHAIVTPFIRYLENVRQGRRPIPFPLLSANPRLCNPQGKRGNLHRNTTDQLGGETGPVFIGVDYGLGNISSTMLKLV